MNCTNIWFFFLSFLFLFLFCFCDKKNYDKSRIFIKVSRIVKLMIIAVVFLSIQAYFFSSFIPPLSLNQFYLDIFRFLSFCIPFLVRKDKFMLNLRNKHRFHRFFSFSLFFFVFKIDENKIETISMFNF